MPYCDDCCLCYWYYATTNAFTTACKIVHFFLRTSSCNHTIWQLFNKHFAINSTDKFLIRCCVICKCIKCTNSTWFLEISTEIGHAAAAATTTRTRAKQKITIIYFGFSMERGFSKRGAVSTSWKSTKTAATVAAAATSIWDEISVISEMNWIICSLNITKKETEEMVFFLCWKLYNFMQCVVVVVVAVGAGVVVTIFVYTQLL